MNKSTFNENIHEIAIPTINKLQKELDNHPVIIIAASHLDMTMLSELYNHLSNIGYQSTINIVIYTRGGDINAARRIALLISDYCDHFNIIAPHYCQSSGTLLALGANTIYYSPLSIFSAIDPHLHGGQEDGCTALSSADIKLFSKMSKEWFDAEISPESNMLGMLCEHIFPPTLTAFYRTVLEVKEIAHELLMLEDKHSNTSQNNIIEALMFSFHSHDYAVTGKQLEALTLPCINNNEINAITWPVIEAFIGLIGGGNRADIESPWCDTVIVSSQRVASRWKDTSGLNPKWQVNS